MADQNPLNPSDQCLSVTRRLITPTSLPVLTIGNLRRIDSDPVYRRQCAERLAEVVDDIERYQGATRLYLP